MKQSIGSSYIYNTIDFDFFVIIARHPKLGVQQGVGLADMMVKILIEDPNYSKACQKVFILLAKRLGRAPEMIDFINKYLNVRKNLLTIPDKHSFSDLS
jgi:hypothetical protein